MLRAHLRFSVEYRENWQFWLVCVRLRHMPVLVVALSAAGAAQRFVHAQHEIWGVCDCLGPYAFGCVGPACPTSFPPWQHGHYSRDARRQTNHCCPMNARFLLFGQR